LASRRGEANENPWRSLSAIWAGLPYVICRGNGLIAFGKSRAKEGAGPVTIGMDVSHVRTVLVHATAIHDRSGATARTALRRLGLIARGKERDRRPTQDELGRIIAYVDNNPRQLIPLGRIIKFAVATAMRLDEICQLRIEDLTSHAGLQLYATEKIRESRLAIIGKSLCSA
jgi:integrase